MLHHGVIYLVAQPTDAEQNQEDSNNSATDNPGVFGIPSTGVIDSGRYVFAGKVVSDHRYFRNACWGVYSCKTDYFKSIEV